MTDDRDLPERVERLEAKVAELEALVDAMGKWLPALSGDIVKSMSVMAYRFRPTDEQKAIRKQQYDEIFENYYRLNPDARPKDEGK